MAVAQHHTWDIAEISLAAERDYGDPYTDAEVWFDLRGPGFAKRAYGFWDDRRDYRLRIVAMSPCEWSWGSGSNQKDAGLNGQAGSLEAAP